MNAAWDVTGDGAIDLVASAPYDPPTDGGDIYVLDDPMAGGDVSTAAVGVISGVAGEKWGFPTLLVDDLNGDGVGDLVVSGFLSAAAGPRSGKVYVFYGPLVGTLGAADADVTITADRDFEWLGEAMVATDFDGDGLRDLAIGVPRDLYNGQGDPGRVLVFRSPLPPGALYPADASLELVGDTPDGHAGGVLVGGFDADGDGKEDLVVGAPYAKDANGAPVGRVFWVRGRSIP